MEKRLTFNSLTYCIGGDDYELRFGDRRLSFRTKGGARILIDRLAWETGTTPMEMRTYIRGLREMRQLVKRQIRNLDNVRRFCGPEHRRQLSGPVPDPEMRGYLEALKDIDRICGQVVDKLSITP